MLDANARHLPKGLEFFLEVHSVDKESKIHQLGIRQGDVILCTMMDESPDNPEITIHLESGDATYKSNPLIDTFNWLVYAGRKDLTQFLEHDPFGALPKAKEILKRLQ